MAPGDARRYALFAAFGGGCSWFATTLGYMQVPRYQKSLTGLELSNRLELGYNLGTAPAALWVAAAMLGWKPTRRGRARCVLLLLATQLAAVALLVAATPGSPLFSVEALAAAMFLGGSVGYLSQFVVVPYLVAGFENELVGAFWTGDAATSVIAALVAIVQRPAADPPTFGARAYHAGVGIPVVLASAAAFLYVERAGAGRLAGAPADGEARGRLLDDEDGVELVGAGDVSDAPPPASRCSSLAPDGAPAYWKDALTWQLAAVVFWSQFADWGMGDSVYPYACANASSTPDVAGCEMWSNELSLAAQLVGCFFASRVALDGRNLGATLWAPVAVYTGWFGLLLYTSWSGALSLPRLSERGVLVDLFVLRGLGPYARAVVPRLIQPCYAKTHHEDLPVFFGVVGVLGNVGGSLVATGLIGARQFRLSAN